MICVRLIKDGFRCDMCFRKPNYEIMADDRYNELPAFRLHLCKTHAKQLAKNIYDAIMDNEDGGTDDE